MKKRVYYTPFISLTSGIQEACGDAMMTALARAFAMIDAMIYTENADEFTLPIELINITTQKLKDGTWCAIALLKQGEWVHTPSIPEDIVKHDSDACDCEDCISTTRVADNDPNCMSDEELYGKR